MATAETTVINLSSLGPGTVFQKCRCIMVNRVAEEKGGGGIGYFSNQYITWRNQDVGRNPRNWIEKIIAVSGRYGDVIKGGKPHGETYARYWGWTEYVMTGIPQSPNYKPRESFPCLSQIPSFLPLFICRQPSS